MGVSDGKGGSPSCLVVVMKACSGGLRTAPTGTTAPQQHRDYSAVIAAIPILALLALCALAGVMSLGGAASRGARRHPYLPQTAPSATGELVCQAPKNPVHVLRSAPVQLSAANSCPSDSALNTDC